MKSNVIITEEMRFRQRVVEYAIKHDNNAKAARRYHTSRQQVQRWRKRYDGTVQSLANRSRRIVPFRRIFYAIFVPVVCWYGISWQL